MTTNRDSQDALQKAVYDALVAAHTVSVFDHVTQGQSKPYIEVGDIDADEWGDKTGDGTSCAIEVSHFTVNRGRKDCRALQRITYDALHHAELTVTAHNVILVVFDGSTCERMDDGLTYHGVSRFRILLESTE